MTHLRLALLFRPIAHWTTGFSYVNAMNALGLDFEPIDNRDLLERGRTLDGFDACVMIDDGFAIQRYTQNLTPKRAYVGIDYHNGFEKHYKPMLDQFNYIYAANWTHGVKLLEQHGIQSAWLPNAYDPVGMPYYELERDNDAAFIASYSTERRWYLREIVLHKWKGIADSLHWAEMSKALCRTKIAFNDAGRKSDGDITNNIINMRVMEVLGCGALLFGYIPEGVPDWELLGLHSFEGWWMSGKVEMPWVHEGPHPEACWIRWRDWTQLEYTYDYFIAHKEEREAIAAKGRAIALKHTYAHRVMRILCDMFDPQDVAESTGKPLEEVLDMAYSFQYPLHSASLSR